MKRFCSLLLISFFTFVLAACGGGGGSAGTPGGSANPSNFRVNAPAEAVLVVGQKAVYPVSGGVAPYGVTNSAPHVVGANVVGSQLEVLPLREGVSTLTVSPSGGGASFSLVVTVVASASALQVQAPDPITLRVGSAQSYAIVGGVAPYKAVSSSPAVASADMVDGALRVVATGLGTAVIEVYGATSGVPVIKTVSVVSTTALFTSAPTNLVMGAGTNRSFSVGGGVAPYFVASSNAAVVDASVFGGTLTVTALAGTGSANVVLRDSAGSLVTVAVAVGNNAAFFSSAPAAVTLQGGAVRTFTLGGGVSPYQVASANTQIVTAAVTGNSVTLTAQNKGSATVNLVDAAGTALKIDVTVTQSTNTSASAIDLTTSLAAIKSAGEEAFVTAVVKNAANVGMPGQDVVFTASSGTLLAPSAQTDVLGVATVRLSPGSDKSVRTIVVSAAVGSVTRVVNIGVVGTALTLTGSTALQLGSPSTTYTVRALDSSGNAIPGASLAVASSLGNSLSAGGLITDVNGNASFTYTPSAPGTDRLTVSGLGTSGALTVNVSAVNFAVQAPLANSNVTVGVEQAVTVRYLNGGVPVAGQTVHFTTTRGALNPANGIAVTDAAGQASVLVRSSSAGLGTVTAQIPPLAPAVLPIGEVKLPLNFVATVPAAIQLQANPGALAPNPSGDSNQATLEATVKDVNGNPVANQQVGFTIMTDPSNGRLQSGIALTDANGKARTNFIAGASSTANNGVTVRAQVLPDSIATTAALTVSGNALFINIGYGNEISNADSTTYSKPFSVYVTDANGVAVGNQQVTLSVIPEGYAKGRLAWSGSVWAFAAGSPTVACSNEDRNRNGVLDLGEDTSVDGRLTPGNIAVSSPGILTTDAAGRASFALLYGEQFAPWSTVQLIARASVAGTESQRALSFVLSGLASDFSVETAPPAGQTSPFGVSTVCTDSL